MRRIVMLVLGTAVLVSASAIAKADLVFSFDPDDLIQAYPAAAGTQDVVGQSKATQLNARRTHQPWASNMYETFYNSANAVGQPDGYNAYMNWRDGLGAGEGIRCFNIWLLDNPRARSWGESTVWDPNGAVPTGTADADGKWDVSVFESPWGEGWIVQWSTDNPDYYINSTSDIGEFSFSGAVYHDNNQNAYDSSDTEVQLGEELRVWFGAVNATEADGQGGFDESLSVVFDDQGWGTRQTNVGGPWSSIAGPAGAEGNGSGYEGVLNITATPEPTTLALLCVGGLAMLRRRR